MSTNGSAVDAQGPDVLAHIARELVTVDAKLRSQVKRLLMRHKYPPDKRPGAIRLVIEQTESMAPRYAAWGLVQGSSPDPM